ADRRLNLEEQVAEPVDDSGVAPGGACVHPLVGGEDQAARVELEDGGAVADVGRLEGNALGPDLHAGVASVAPGHPNPDLEGFGGGPAVVGGAPDDEVERHQ